ncbi:MAG: FMN-binding negative transcriptional regulator [Acidocella sp.]|nr:FMN-binding negative transcriptional regulator [Acidocella sp.]
MYTPPAFKIHGDDELHAIIAAASLPILISPSAGGLLVTHMPLKMLGANRLVGHVARANIHWRDFDPAADSLAIFTAADGYISPSWYASKAEHGRVVPTWNYQAVHITGRLEIITEPGPLLEIVSRLTQHYESGRTHPWAVSDAPNDYIAAQLKGIVGVVLHVTHIEGKAKLSQNRNKADRDSAEAGVATENETLAAAMRAANGTIKD